MVMTDDLRGVLGVEHTLDDVSWALRYYVGALGAPVVGAVHVTCADESERECSDSFQRNFVNVLLPDLKFAEKAAFRLSNLGGRYEWGAIAMAERHFATPESRGAFKVLLVKINAHVAVTGSGEAARFGPMQRYDTTSTACGALHALLEGGQKPFLNDLRHAFQSDGRRRLEMLLDPQQVEPARRTFFAAVVNAQLQARRAEREIYQHMPASPTLYLISSCVTLNRAGQRDSELLCGFGTIDQRTDSRTVEYTGLGDDPTRYRIRHTLGRLCLSDDQWPG
jgi:hypothetical protein